MCVIIFWYMHLYTYNIIYTYLNQSHSEFYECWSLVDEYKWVCRKPNTTCRKVVSDFLFISWIVVNSKYSALPKKYINVKRVKD